MVTYLRALGVLYCFLAITQKKWLRLNAFCGAVYIANAAVSSDWQAPASAEGGAALWAAWNGQNDAGKGVPTVLSTVEKVFD
jgi:hypothetical protein